MSIRLLLLACGLLATMSVGAQGTLDPVNPPEPSLPEAKYRLTLSTSPAGAAKTLTGGGDYVAGSRVNIRTAGNTYYTFLHWEQDGTVVSTAANFSYTMPEEHVQLVAVYSYDYNPQNPSEPSTPTTTTSYPLYLVAQPANGGTFSRSSGLNTVEGSTVTITATPTTGYVFDGWYDEAGELVSGSNRLNNYVMPSTATTLTARFHYSPTNPGEPSGNQDDVDYILMGDANRDGKVSITDAVAIVNYILGNASEGFFMPAADVNGDGKISITDAVGVVNIILNKQE